MLVVGESMSGFSLNQGNARIAARLTPWDRRALGFPTAEIVDLAAHDLQSVACLLDAVEEWCRGQSVQYLFGRVSSTERLLKEALLDRGYQFVETSLVVSRGGFLNLPAAPKGMTPLLRPATRADVKIFRRIAEEDFHHGRFLEDPAIDSACAALRTANWVEDLVEEGLVFAAELRGQVIGFHAERVHPVSSSAELLLTGAASPYAVFALPLWIAALQSLAERDIRQCTTLISAANTGVLNLYARLGFQFNATLLGFRKFV